VLPQVRVLIQLLLLNSRIDKEIVPLVHSLCQDVASEVRTSICRQLPVITKGLSSDAVLLPLIVELAIDEEPSVRLAAVQAIADLLPHLKQGTTVLPGGGPVAKKFNSCFAILTSY